jgi:hypothetical protein
LRKATGAAITLALMVVCASINAQQASGDASILPFWEKFRNAVINGEKATVANMSQFPIGMPYGMREIKNRAQLITRYGEVFNGEADAAKCFRDSKPTTNPERPKEIEVSCKMKGGGDEEPVVYSFTRTRAGWRFNGLDNINE